MSYFGTFTGHIPNRIIWNTNIAYNESIIRRFALNLLKKYQEVAEPIVRAEKIAIKTLRKILIADDSRMEKLLYCFLGVFDLTALTQRSALLFSEYDEVLWNETGWHI